MTCKYFTVKTC